MIDEAAALPLPQPSPDTEPFWAAARERRLVMPKCDRCAQYSFPPSNACLHCGHDALTWVDVCGRGTVYTFTVMHRVYHPAFRDRIPYVVAVIALEEGPRLISNIVGTSVENVRCDMPVRVVFDDIRADYIIPQFIPADRV